MLEALIVALSVLSVGAGALLWKQRNDKQRELRSHSISPEALHDLLEAKEHFQLLDLRVPLDLLGYTEIIPGARRIAPSEIIADPNMISKEENYVLYCTCPGETSSEAVLKAAIKMGFLRVKVLTGGIEAWKQRGYPTVPYNLPFHLDVH